MSCLGWEGAFTGVALVAFNFKMFMVDEEGRVGMKMNGKEEKEKKGSQCFFLMGNRRDC